MSKLPERQRDLKLTDLESAALAKHFGLIRALAAQFKNWGVPDMEGELMLQAVRIMPSWDQKRALGPFLKSSLSRYAINLLRDRKKRDKEKVETDQAGNDHPDILVKTHGRELDPLESAIAADDEIANWGSGGLDRGLPPPDPVPKKPKPGRVKALRWVKKNAHLFGRWRGIRFYCNAAGIEEAVMREAIKKAGFALRTNRRHHPKVVDMGDLFGDACISGKTPEESPWLFLTPQQTTTQP
jgi:hypothetical protein